MSRVIRILVLVTATLVCTANADVPKKISFQGKVSSISGVWLTGAHDFVFRLYETSVGGDTLWNESRTLEVDGGRFQTYLGEVNPLTPEIFESGQTLWLEMEIDGAVFPDRSPLVSVAYSFHAMRADTALYAISVGDSLWHTDGNDIFRVSGNVGIGISDPSAKLHVNGTFGVGEDSQGYDVKFFGAENNSGIFWDASKMGLRIGSAHIWPDSIGTKSLATGHNTRAIGDYSTAMGGFSAARGDYSTAIGKSAKAENENAVAVGEVTTASGRGSLAMGHYTTASGAYSTSMGSSTTASGTSSIAMGSSTTAIGAGSTAMGQRTTAVGLYSTALGYETTAGGHYSTAVGRWVSTASTTENTLVFGAGLDSDNPLVNNVANSLMIGFSTTVPTLFVGGNGHRVGVGTSDPAEKLDIDGGIRIGNSAGANPGTMRWTGGDFEGYDGAVWRSLTAGGGLGDITAVDAGHGLTGGGTVGDIVLHVGAGDGIDVLPNTVSVDVTDIAGDGLVEDGANNLRVNTGMGLTVNLGAVQLEETYLDGTAYDSRFVEEDQGGSVTSPMIVDGTIQSADIGQNGATTGQVMKWNGSTWAAADDISGTGEDGDWTISGDDIFATLPGNVGIGTTSPSARLEVISSAGEAVYVANSATSGALATFDGTNSGNTTDGVRIYYHGSGDALFVNAQGDGMAANFSGDVSIDGTISTTSGNVGIGTATPVERLDVLGTTRTTGFKMPTGASYGYVMTSDAYGIGTWQPLSGGGSNTLDEAYDEGGAGAGRTVTADAGPIRIAGPDGLVVDSDVGIGTVSPGAKLDVISSGGEALYVENSSTSGPVATFESTNSAATANAVRIYCDGSGDALYVNAQGTGLAAEFDGEIVVNGQSTVGGDLNVNGETTTDVLNIQGGSDLAERFNVTGSRTPRPGMVMVIDPENPGKLKVAEVAYDKRVAGVISGANGIRAGVVLSQPGTEASGEHLMALSGRVYCWADATFGAIQPGDMVTTSDNPGYAMKVQDHAKAQGSVLGKAMGSLESGQGLILVLITLQ